MDSIKIGIGTDEYENGFVSWVVTDSDGDCFGHGSIRRRGGDRRKPWEWASLAARHVRVGGHRILWSRATAEKLGGDDNQGNAQGALLTVPVQDLRPGRR